MIGQSLVVGDIIWEMIGQGSNIYVIWETLRPFFVAIEVSRNKITISAP